MDIAKHWIHIRIPSYSPGTSRSRRKRRKGIAKHMGDVSYDDTTTASPRPRHLNVRREYVNTLSSNSNRLASPNRFRKSQDLTAVIVAYDRSSSGIASYTLDLASLLSEGLDCHVVAFDPFEEDRPPFRVINLCSKKSRFPHYFPLIYGLEDRRQVRDIIGEIDADVVIETLPPIASSLRNVVSLKWGYVGYAELALIRASQLRFPLTLGALPVTAQHWLGDWMSFRNAQTVLNASGWGNQVIHPPARIRPLKGSNSDGVLRILFVSRDIHLRRKNLAVVLNALKHVRREAELHIVGRGYVAGEKVICHGPMERSEVLDLMRQCDALVLPSTYEELGYVGLEASSLGLAVVASDIPSFRFAVPNAIFFNPTNVAELSSILAHTSLDEFRSVGISCRAAAIQMRRAALERILLIAERMREDRNASAR